MHTLDGCNKSDTYECILKHTNLDKLPRQLNKSSRLFS